MRRSLAPVLFVVAALRLGAQNFVEAPVSHAIPVRTANDARERNPVLAETSSQTLVVAWQRGTELFAAAADGIPLHPEQQATLARIAGRPVIAGVGEGAIVAWMERDALDGPVIVAQRLDAMGFPMLPKVVIAPVNHETNETLSLASDGDRSLLAWSEDVRVHWRLLDDRASVIASGVVEYALFPAVAALRGRFMLAWWNGSQRAIILDETGRSVAGEISIAERGPWPLVVVANESEFVVFWEQAYSRYFMGTRVTPEGIASEPVRYSQYSLYGDLSAMAYSRADGYVLTLVLQSGFPPFGQWAEVLRVAEKKNPVYIDSLDLHDDAQWAPLSLIAHGCGFAVAYERGDGRIWVRRQARDKRNCQFDESERAGSPSMRRP